MKITVEQLPEAVSQLLEKVDNLQKTLARIEAGLSRHEPESGLIDTTQAAAYLSVSRDVILKMADSAEVPSYKIGQKVCFKQDELNEWLSTKRRKSIKEIQQEADKHKRK